MCAHMHCHVDRSGKLTIIHSLTRVGMELLGQPKMQNHINGHKYHDLGGRRGRAWDHQVWSGSCCFCSMSQQVRFVFVLFFLQCLVLFVLRSRIRQGFIFMDHIRYIMNQITSTAVLRRWLGWRPLQRSTSSSKELLEDSTSHRLSSSEEWPGPQILRVLSDPILTKNGNICFR